MCERISGEEHWGKQMVGKAESSRMHGPWGASGDGKASSSDDGLCFVGNGALASGGERTWSQASDAEGEGGWAHSSWMEVKCQDWGKQGWRGGMDEAWSPCSCSSMQLGCLVSGERLL